MKNIDIIKENIKKIKAKHIIVGVILLCGLTLLIYRTLYNNILSLFFNDSLYLPFYRVQGIWILRIILVAIVLVAMRKSIWKPVNIFLWSVVLFVSFFLIKNIGGDLMYVVKNEYLTVECTIDDIEVKIQFGGRFYPPYKQAEIFKEVNGKYQQITVPSDVYDKISKEPKDRKIRVYYLPHHNCPNKKNKKFL